MGQYGTVTTCLRYNIYSAPFKTSQIFTKHKSKLHNTSSIATQHINFCNAKHQLLHHNTPTIAKPQPLASYISATRMQLPHHLLRQQALSRKFLQSSRSSPSHSLVATLYKFFKIALRLFLIDSPVKQTDIQSN